VNLDAIGTKRLPEDPRKEIIESSCKHCDTFDRITSAHRPLAGWRVIVREMEQRGASVEPLDVGPLVQYLAKNLGLARSGVKSAGRTPLSAAAQ